MEQNIRDLRQDFLNKVEIQTQIKSKENILKKLQEENTNLSNELIEAFNSGRNIFLTGSGGTGKSTLAKLFPMLSKKMFYLKCPIFTKSLKLFVMQSTLEELKSLELIMILMMAILK